MKFVTKFKIFQVKENHYFENTATEPNSFSILRDINDYIIFINYYCLNLICISFIFNKVDSKKQYLGIWYYKDCLFSAWNF